MQAKMFKDLVQASSIVDVLKLVEKADIKTTSTNAKKPHKQLWGYNHDTNHAAKNRRAKIGRYAKKASFHAI